uniref:Uncharacterized protein n=1 Tax=Rhizophora mucronata TaxID=61149 RepID=A0A2P2N4Z6_RHIMU
MMDGGCLPGVGRGKLKFDLQLEFL